MTSINYTLADMVYFVCLKLRFVVIKFDDHRFPDFRIILKPMTLNSKYLGRPKQHFNMYSFRL